MSLRYFWGLVNLKYLKSTGEIVKTTLIGHACLLIQSNDTTVLTDPVWFDDLWEEVNVLCPQIELKKEKVPRVDILNLSHRHQDHFDVRTLAYLARNDQILGPDSVVLVSNDEILQEVLRELEFKNIRVVEDFVPMEIKGLTLTPTPSLNPDDFPEHGLLVNDGEVTIWNQVDTIVNPEIIKYIHKLYGQVDFAHHRFLPLLEGNFTFHKDVNLPFDEYSSFLKVVAALQPKFVVPGSAAFRYKDEYGFLNQYSFPTTQEQFLRDLSDFCPGIQCSTFFSGDEAVITTSGTKIHRQNSEFVGIKEDDSYRVEFKPVAEVTPIRTRTADKAERENEKSAVVDFIENKFLNRIQECEYFDIWIKWKIVYQLEVFGKDESDVWSIDFDYEEPKITRGSLGKINIYEGISFSELYKFINKRGNWDYAGVAAQYRTYNTVYRVNQGSFEFFPPEKKFPNPLFEIFPSNKEMDREKYMKDVRRWKGT